MKRRRALLLSLTILVALCTACGAQQHKEQQEAFNRQLIEALMCGKTETALALVNAGADPNTRRTLSLTPTVKILPNQAPLTVNNSETALMIACGIHWNKKVIHPASSVACAENLPLLQAMLAHGANVNARTWYNLTALHYAVRRDRWRTVQLLLQHGADINAPGNGGSTPLIDAAYSETVIETRVLLAHGANPNAQDNYGQTALHWAVRASNAKSLITELLAHGADPNLCNYEGDTPLDVARQMKCPDLVRLLKQHGAK